MSKVDPYECMHQFEMAAELHVDRVDTHALLQMHPVSGLRREYCTCGLFEGSARRPRGPYACLREVGGDCRAARGQSGHACITATAKCYQNNSVRFAGSAQIFSQAGCLRAPPMDEVATCTCLHMRVLEGSAHGRSRHLHVPPHARSLEWLASRTWTKWPRLHDGSCSLLRGIRPTYCTG